MDYTLIRSKRTTLSLQINAEGALFARAPQRLSQAKIEAFITEKHAWILKKQAEINALKHTKIQYQTGELFLFLGEEYPLKLDNSATDLQFDGQFFYLNPARDGKADFHHFFKTKFAKIARIRLDYYAEKHELVFNQVRFKAQKTRWGSCSAQDNINLNYLLMMAPMSVIDAVITHELAHIKHKNHSANFYDFLSELCPEHKNADGWLKQHARRLHNL